MEATINFEKSDFVALKGVVDQSDDNSLFGYDPNSNSLYGYRPNSVENLFVQINNLILPGTLDVDQLLARPSIVKLIDKFINVWMVRAGSWFKKNVAISDDMRNYGNVEYGRRNFTLAAYLYTMAIVYAPNVSENNDVPKDKVPEELSLAFGNRSAVFFELGLHEACLEDIEHALATGYPRSKLSKLLLCKIECLIALNRLGAAKKAWEHFVATIGTEPKDDERVLKIRLQLLNIGSDDDNQKQDNQMSLPFTNSMLPAIDYLNQTGRYKPSADLAPVSAKLEPRYSSAKGRHLLAKVDIEPGDILMVESPYTTVLDKKYEFHYCHHCCRRLENDLEKSGVKGQLCINGALVSCTECTRVLYCSTVCRTESWRLYHQFECGLQPVLGQLASDAHSSNGIAALRIFLATGLDVIQQVATRNDEDDKVESIPVLGDDPDVASHYEQVYRLHHRDKASLLELGDCVNTSAILVQLAKKCGLVHTDKQAKLTGTILLRHLLQLRINLHKIPSVKRTECLSSKRKKLRVKRK